jgi:iron complex transport system ATP-binding protein
LEETYGTDIAKINEAMELTQISHLATKNITKSVTVNCKKIARALAQDTPLIILMNPLPIWFA